MTLSITSRKTLSDPNNAYGVKKYFVSNAGNITEMYSAFSNAVTGDPCYLLLTEYDGGGNPVKMKGTEGIWDSSYDI